LKSRHNGKKPLRLYNLIRNADEVYINDYNPVLLEAWEGNIDVQYVCEKSAALNTYITGYISKHEKKSTEAIWEEVNKNRVLEGALKSYALRLFKNREVGIYEAADKLLGYNLYEFSDHIKWLTTDHTSVRGRRCKDYTLIEQMPKLSKDVTFNNMLDHILIVLSY